MGLGVFALELVTFALELVIAKLTSWSKDENKLLQLSYDLIQVQLM